MLKAWHVWDPDLGEEGHEISFGETRGQAIMRCELNDRREVYTRTRARRAPWADPYGSPWNIPDSVWLANGWGTDCIRCHIEIYPEDKYVIDEHGMAHCRKCAEKYGIKGPMGR